MGRRGRVAGEPFAEGIAMDSEFGRGAGEVLVMTGEDLEDELLLELADGLFEEDSLGDHLLDQAFEIGLHR